jgi:hypothetical protein
VVPLPPRIPDFVAIPRKPRQQEATASEQLEQLLGEPWPFRGSPPRHNVESWRVIDDWPAQVPVSDAEVAVFEAWFGDVFDALFGPV